MLLGAFSPITGDHFQLILPYCNAHNFQVFLNDFAKENPKELKIMALYNGMFHKAKRLIIPENIVLVFLPPYSPELNPDEKIWAKYKREFTNEFYNSLEYVENFMANIVKATTKKEAMSICGYSYVFLDEIWSIEYHVFGIRIVFFFIDYFIKDCLSFSFFCSKRIQIFFCSFVFIEIYFL